MEKIYIYHGNSKIDITYCTVSEVKIMVLNLQDSYIKRIVLWEKI